jgi:bacillithiol system protein YtxJ
MGAQMANTLDFTTIADLAALDAAFAESHSNAVILFNHDPYCPISAAAFDEMRGVTGDVRMIDVSRLRDITRELAQRTGVGHESPQVIVLRDAEAAWSASHFRITVDAVATAASEKR